MKEQYQYIKVIGFGQQKIHHAIRKSDHKQVAIKIIEYGQMPPTQKQNVVKQVNSLIQMKDSQNVVKYFNHYIDKENSHLYLIMEYYKQGSLKSFLDQRKLRNNQTGQIKYLDQKKIWEIFGKIVYGLNSIHKGLNGNSKIHIIHRNIKPSNIFLDGNKIKIGDFGRIAKLSNQNQFSKTLNTNTYYLSPQQINGLGCTQKTDIWALGCLLYQMAALRHPFPGNQEFQIIQKIKEMKRYPLPKHYSSELSRVVDICLSPNPENRPSVNDIIYYPQIMCKLRQQKHNNNILMLKEYKQKISQRKKRCNNLEEEIKQLKLQLQKRSQLNKTKQKQKRQFPLLQKVSSIKEQSKGISLITPNLLLKRSLE